MVRRLLEDVLVGDQVEQRISFLFPETVGKQRHPRQAADEEPQLNACGLFCGCAAAMSLLSFLCVTTTRSSTRGAWAGRPKVGFQRFRLRRRYAG